MYTLRIIDQTNLGAEKRDNIFIGNEYSIVMKVPEKPIIGENYFNKAISSYHGIDNIDSDFSKDSCIVGFIYYGSNTRALNDWEVVYIVNQEGKTIERIYGTYEKY